MPSRRDQREAFAADQYRATRLQGPIQFPEIGLGEGHHSPAGYQQLRAPFYLVVLEPEAPS